MVALAPNDVRWADDAERAFRALGIPTPRIEILRTIAQHREISTSAIMVDVGLTRNGLRHHLDALREAGFVADRHTTHPRGSGPITYWSLDETKISDALDALSDYLLSTRG